MKFPFKAYVQKNKLGQIIFTGPNSYIGPYCAISTVFDQETPDLALVSDESSTRFVSISGETVLGPFRNAHPFRKKEAFIQDFKNYWYLINLKGQKLSKKQNHPRSIIFERIKSKMNSKDFDLIMDVPFWKLDVSVMTTHVLEKYNLNSPRKFLESSYDHKLMDRLTLKRLWNIEECIENYTPTK